MLKTRRRGASYSIVSASLVIPAALCVSPVLIAAAWTRIKTSVGFWMTGVGCWVNSYLSGLQYLGIVRERMVEGRASMIGIEVEVLAENRSI